MADLSKSQQKRAEARQRRRKDAEPESKPADAVEATDGQQSNDAVKQAAKIMAGVAAAGAAAAAARAFTSHDEEPESQQEEEPETEAKEQPEPEAQEQPADEPEHETEPEADGQPELEEEEREPVAGADGGDVRRVLDRARDQLEDLLGRPVESVSSLERTHDGWVLALEVVEVRRVPETMDVLASYEMELDDDLNLRRYHQGRRYHRARSGSGEDL